MINSDEMLFVVDENNNPIEPKPRVEVHSKGYWHRMVHIWITDDKGNLLCLKRSSNTQQAKGLWASGIGGHVQAKSTEKNTAIREVYEELGIVVNELKLEDVMTVKNELEHEFQSVYIYRWSGNIDILKIEKDEIDEVKWTPIKEVYAAINDDKNKDWAKISALYASQFIKENFSQYI